MEYQINQSILLNNTDTIDAHTIDESQKHYTKWKMLHTIYIKFSKRQNYSDRSQISGCLAPGLMNRGT